MSLDKKIIAELKEVLLREKKDLEQNLSQIAKPVNKESGDYETSFENIGTDRDDNATEVEQYTDNLPVEITLGKKLQDVIEALKKIADGTYGTCANCQQEIDVERLRANPSAKTCIKCK